MRIFLLCVLGLAGVIAAGLAINEASFRYTEHYAPKYEGVRRDVMIESRAYTEGETRRLYDMQRQYLQAKTPEEKNAIKAMAIYEATTFDKTRLPADLRQFIATIGG